MCLVATVYRVLSVIVLDPRPTKSDCIISYSYTLHLCYGQRFDV